MSQMSDPTTLRQSFLEGMSQAACTVNIVTTDGPAGRYGVTVSAMSSVSADSAKPSLLVCVHHKSGAAEAIQRNGVFCVNVLRDDQADVSDTFAGRIRTTDGDKFSSARWTTQRTGAPRIVDPLVAFDCKLAQSLRYGSHHVFFGEVEDIFVASGRHPLIYANRAYGTPARLEPRTATPPDPARTGETLRLGCLITLAPYVVPALLSRFLAQRPGTGIELSEMTHTKLIEALQHGDCEMALTYGFDLDPALETTPLTDFPAYVLLPQDHPLSHSAAVSLEDLAREPMILLDLPMSRDYFLGLFKAQGLEPNIRLRSSNFETVRGLVGHGLGFALLGTKPANSLSYDGCALVTRPIKEGSPDSRVVLISAAGGKERVPAKAFRGICEEFFRRARAS